MSENQPAPPADSPEHEYRVNLDIYSGPLELLLFLIKREEIDIQNIPIARITEQYLKHIEIIRRIDINLAGEFLVMAATLMEIKSRMLVPKPKVDPNDPNAPQDNSSVEDFADPRQELVRQLLAYKEFKDAADELKRRGETESARYPRAVPKPTGITPLDIEDLDLFRLIDAFNAIMASIGHSAFGHEVVYDDTPISLHQADILDRLVRDETATTTGVSLRQLFEGRTKKSEMIGLFLAMLELIRQKKIAVEQSDALGDVKITLRQDVPDQALFNNEAAVPPSTETSAPDTNEPTQETPSPHGNAAIDTPLEASPQNPEP